MVARDSFIERWTRKLRLVPYPPRAAELEAEMLQRRGQVLDALKAEEATGRIKGPWQRWRFVQTRRKQFQSRELVQMQAYPILWFMILIYPIYLNKNHDFFAFALLLPVVMILDPFFVWIGSFIVPRGGLSSWQSGLLFMLSMALGLCAQFALSGVFART